MSFCIFTQNEKVDFVLQYNGKVVPLEVKAEENLQAKSLKVYQQKFRPALALRLSMSDYRTSDWLVNLPLYAISMLKQVAGKKTHDGLFQDNT